jgi:Cu-Zn family superoxide dismutase
MTNAIRTRLLAATACSLLAACASAPPAQVAKTTPAASSAREAVAILASASGSLVSGKLALVPMGDGVHVTGQVGGLKPGDSAASISTKRRLQRGGRVQPASLQPGGAGAWPRGPGRAPCGRHQLQSLMPMAWHASMAQCAA